MSNLSELLPAGAGAKSAEFVASGTLSNGQTVVLNSDGTVSAVASDGIPQVIGTQATFSSSSLDSNICAVYDSNANKVIVVFTDSYNGYVGATSVGTINGTTISFASRDFFSGGRRVYGVSAAFDSDTNKIVIAFADLDNSYYSTAVVGTVSGTSMTFGTRVVMESQSNYWDTNTHISSTVYDTANSKVVTSYYNATGRVSSIVGTVSGTTTSWGSSVQVPQNVPSEYITSTYDAASGKVVIAFADAGNNKGEIAIGTVSGTSISYSQVQFEPSGRPYFIDISYSPSLQKSILVYADSSSTYRGAARIITTLGGLGVGSKYYYQASGACEWNQVCFDESTGKIVVAYSYAGNSDYGTISVGTVSGTAISFDPSVTYRSATAIWTNTVYSDQEEKTVIAFKDYGNSQTGTGLVFQNEASNVADFIGITDQAIADTATGAVIVKGGVSEKVSSLTTGSDYYVQADGTLSTTVSSAPAGRALSSTSILLEG